jgi:hypothetical protein
VGDGQPKGTKKFWKSSCTYTNPLSGKKYFAYYFVSSEIAYLLSHLMSVLQHLEPAWTRAFLRRTRFLDPDFQGDVLAIISKGIANSSVCSLLKCAISV